MKCSSVVALVMLFFTGLLCAPLSAADEPPRPNVVLILADDLGYMDVGADNPQTFYKTPHLNALASSGMLFTHGYAACPVCSPTRASIMTGKYPPRTGITDFIGGDRAGRLRPAANQDHLALDEVTIAERFRDAGYATFFAGKWHLGDGDFSPNAQGFGPGLEGKYTYYPKREEPAERPRRPDSKNSERIADDAIRFIEAHRDRPFFAYLPFEAVHIPFEDFGRSAESLRRRTDEKERARGRRGLIPQADPADEWGRERDSKVRLVQNNRGYAVMLGQMDSAIGRVLKALDSEGLAERTIVVFTSDNGGLSTAEGHPTSNAPLRAGKGWLYEGGLRVPWIIRAPGLAEPRTICDSPVCSIDLFPTLLELAGLPPNPPPQVDGVSLVPALRTGHLKRAAPLFWHYPHYGNQGGAPAGAIRDGQWKLIEWFEDGALELYNLLDDPGERKNLAVTMPDKTAELHDKLTAWRADLHVLMPTPSP